MELIFATHNENKIKEIKALLPGRYKLLSLTDIGEHEEVEESGKTIKENALIKAKYIYNKYKISCFADDTGLEVKVLNGEPGVRSARYAGEHKSSKDNIVKLLDEMKDAIDRRSQFLTVIALILCGKEVFFEGFVEGEICKTPAGDKGFGYDPVFKPIGFDKTFAEISMDEKNKISHRGKAVNKLVDYLNKIG